MNIKILHQWLAEYLETKATPANIQAYVSLSGPCVERIEDFKGDKLYDFEITTNRIDTASVIGLAREAHAILTRQGLKSELKPLVLAKENKPSQELELRVSDSDNLCRRIMAVVMDNVQISQSPEFIKKRLEAAGIRSLNSLIDVTNYVMLEVGHPTHVFDYDRIKTKQLLIRQAKDGEVFVSLDHKKYQLNRSDIVIEDGKGNIIDLPGIMGAANSVVTNHTKRIIFFIEANDPVKIRRTSMRLGIRTMAASYNENSPDSELIKTALLRGMYLFKEYNQARQAKSIIDLYPTPVKPTTVSVDLAEVEKHIGVKVSATEVLTILQTLGFKQAKKPGTKLSFIVPTYRAEDVHLKEDLIEEIARIYGYARIPEELSPFAFISDEYIRNSSAMFRFENQVKQYLANIGFFELYNYSMISEEENELFGLPEDSIRMNNPMSKDLLVFRQSLIPSLSKNSLTNIKQAQLNIFEIANVYLPNSDNLPNEVKTLALLVKDSYSVLKGIIESLFAHLNIDLEQVEFRKPIKNRVYLNQSLSIEIYFKQQLLGYLGTLSKPLLYNLGLKAEHTVAELNLAVLLANSHLLEPIKEISKLMPVIEDLTYKQDKNISWQELIKIIKMQFPEVVKIELVSHYQEYVTMRIYSYPKKAKSVLYQIIAYLEKTKSLMIKKSTIGNNK